MNTQAFNCIDYYNNNIQSLLYCTEHGGKREDMRVNNPHWPHLSLQDLLQKSLQNKKNNAVGNLLPRKLNKNSSICTQTSHRSILRAALHHTGATAAAKLAFAFISRAPEVAKPS